MSNKIENSSLKNLDEVAKKLANHYSSYVNSPFLRKAMNMIEITKTEASTINDFMRMISAGLTYDLNFFYELELALAHFCDVAYYKVAPGIGTTLYGAREMEQMGLSVSEQSMCKILVNSFASNIKQLARYTSELYQITVDLDTNTSAAHKKSRPIYTTINDIEKIDALLLPILAEL